MKSSTKFILASLFVTIVTVTLFGIFTLNRYHDSEVTNANIRLEACIRTFWQLLSHKGSDFRIVDNKLQVDGHVLNGDFELPDRIQEIFGGVATIFMYDERVSTNVLNARGERAVGTRLVGPAYDSVFKKEKPYRGTTTILGIPYLTAYDPISDNAGKIIGVLFVGIKESDFLANMHAMKTQMTLTMFFMVTVFTFLMVLLGLSMKRVEENNENQLKFQHTLLNTIPNPIFYKDSSCRYLGCNKAFEEYVGFTSEELVGRSPHDLWPRELADSYRDQDLSTISDPGMNTCETTVQYADGTLRDVIFNKATFSGKDGSVAGLVGVILDITERKRAEDEKIRLQSQLAYTRLMETIMIRLGHDLKTPLTPLFILLPLLKKQLTDPVHIKHLETCIKSAVSIKSLADKTRTLARLSSCSEEQKREEVSLAALVDEAIADLKDALSRNQQECRNSVNPLIMVHGVQEQLRELLNNLLSNSIHFSDAQGVTTISAEEQDDCVLVAVRDQGAGIAVSHLEHVFDEFYKTDESRHNRDTSGLGLSICKRIVLNHSGRIWAESPGSGRGTTINFTIARVRKNDHHPIKETL